MKGKQASRNHRSDRGGQIGIGAGRWSGKCLIELFHYAEVYGPLQNPKYLYQSSLSSPPLETWPLQMRRRPEATRPPSRPRGHVGAGGWIPAGLAVGAGLGVSGSPLPRAPAAPKSEQARGGRCPPTHLG